eukprot:CAMPEP_0197735026 /NCGR_PEP_ID=MMETSP1435-20131217/185_1 /TAXON_ID=426625 /ORGANISM="Chaetoceros brevis, Strain CCMP164" /LENGTH=201 /DNA_ID=CAMNT_0043322541 /DNA_START=29 /DNA_END=634 /DNA_ORIENTATION=+
MKLIIATTLAASAAAFAPSASIRAVTSLDANVYDTLVGLEGPGQVWGADGIAVGKEEADLKGYDNFGLFTQRLASTGVAATLAGAGPFTVFAPTDTAIESYETTVGPITADVLNYCIVPGNVSSGAVSSAPLTTLQGSAITYSRKFRKDFVDDAILGEATFGQFSNFPTDVACDNGVVHSIGMVIVPGYGAVGGGVGQTQL